MKARHPDPEIAYAYASEALLLHNEINAIREEAATIHTDKPEAAFAGAH